MSSNVIDSLKQQYNGKKVLVVGLGILGGGAGIAGFFAGLGAQVTVTDLKGEQALQESIDKLQKYGIKFKLGKHDIEDFVNADLVFKAPKMRWDAPEIVAAIQKGVPVEMEVSFFLKYCPANVIGVTGTRGKSTTTHMIYEVLRNSLKIPVHIGGNLPNISTIEMLERVQQGDQVVLEISSWQLSSMHRARLSPHIGVFTSFYPDHLDYYANIEEYLYDKQAIYMYQKQDDYLVINRQAHEATSKKTPASIVIEYSATDFPSQLSIKGEHNLDNAAAAFKVAQLLGVPDDQAAATLSAFKGVPYRLQQVKKTEHVTFINDTTSTTPTSTIKALESFNDKPIILILGGNGKNLPYEELISKLNKVNFIVLLQGTFTNEIIKILEEKYPTKFTQPFDDLKLAVERAYQESKNIGDSYILFSPGATSFAMFANEFHRGDEFNRIVREI